MLLTCLITALLKTLFTTLLTTALLLLPGFAVPDIALLKRRRYLLGLIKLLSNVRSCLSLQLVIKNAV